MKTQCKFSFLLSFFFIGLASRSQNINEVSVGDSLSSFEIGEIINFSKKSIKTSDYRDKLLIFDFWTTTCIPCLAAFPKLDSLQKEYSSEVLIMSVTSEPKEKAADLLSKLQKVRKIVHPSVVGDTLLEKLFPYDVVPHVVWIKNNKVIAITSGDEITRRNISSVLQGVAVNLPLKKDFQSNIMSPQSTMTFAPSVHIAEGNDIKLIPLGSDKLLLSSVLTRSVDNFPASTEYSDLWLLSRNLVPSLLLKTALWGGRNNMLNSQSIINEITDSLLLRKLGFTLDNIKDRTEVKNLIKEYSYCYEIYVPESLAKQKFDIMLNDLNQYFGYMYGIEAVMEKRSQKYLALTVVSKKDKLASKGGEWIGEANAYWIKLQNAKINSLITRLIQPLQLYPPIINETDYSGNIDIELNCELKNLESVNGELLKYGLKLVEKEKMLEVGVVRMKKHN